MTPEINVWLTIGLCAFATYSLRVGGLLMASCGGQLPKTGRFRQFMDALPGTILLSLIAPGILSAGVWGMIGALCTAVCAWKTRNLFLAMITGVAIVAVSRQMNGV